MKLFMLLFILILIKCFQTKKYVRKLLIIRDKEMDKNGLSQFSILNSDGKEYLYRLKSSYDYNDELSLINFP